ncbi:MAG: hypothetical protein K2I42_05260 [Anaeroplasmataceae bacterium]|nr:hypothetical protein [Anaeroplasmataceae bacterium]
MKKLCIIGVLIVSVLGTLFHFGYSIVPIFIFPKNESIFEHTKLIVFPFLIYFFACLPFYKENKETLFSSFVFAIIVSTIFTVVSYYTYSGVLGKNIDVINIIIYYISVILGFILIYKKKIPIGFSNSIIFLIIILILTITFTYYPLNISFFIG